MQAPPLPKNEKQRLEALCELQILDTGPEERFDRFTRIAQFLFDVPMAIISLVDVDRQWFKSRQGLEASETPRGISFCGHAILADDIFCIQNALDDARFADNPLVVGPLHIRFYAGAPLAAAEGSHVGTLCILDTKPRTLTDAQLRILKDLAQCVANELNQVKLKNTVRELAEQRRYTESILDSVSEGIIAIDHRGSVHSFNPAAERIFGYAARQVIGNHFSMLLAEHDSAELAGSLQRYLAGGEITSSGIRREVGGRRSDGTLFPVGLAIGKMDIGGEPMFNSVVRDITTQKKLEQMKNEFISTISHEFRTPLTSIMGSLGLIKGGAFGEVSEEIQSMLEIAYGSSEKLIRLVGELLDLEKIKSGRLKLSSVQTDLVALAEATMLEIEGFQRKFNVEVTLSKKVESAWVMGDPDQLARVVTNFLSNAIKFSPAGGVVEVEVSCNNGKCRLSVTDFGPGIPVEFQADLFTRFSQADTSDSRPKGGTGLGLSIAKAIVDLHGGEIGYTTSPHNGTSFYFDLPDYRGNQTGETSTAGHVGRTRASENVQGAQNVLRDDT